MTTENQAPEGTELPQLPMHPEPHTYTWTALEARVIEQYGKDCARAALAAQPQAALQSKLQAIVDGATSNEGGLTSSLRAVAADALAAQPKQAPVALTDEQIAEGWDLCGGSNAYEAWRAGVRWAESEHGIPALQTKEPTNDR